MANYIRKEKSTYRGYIYYYICEKCGKEYTRSLCGKHISGLCGECSRKRDYDRQLKRKAQHEKDLINDVLDAIICDLLVYESGDLIPVYHVEDIVKQYYKKEGKEGE